MQIFHYFWEPKIGDEEEREIGFINTYRTPFGRKWRAIIAEFFGTAILVFFAIGAAVSSLWTVSSNGSFDSLIIPLGTSFGIAAALYSIANFSGGHLNPALTVPLIILRRIDVITGIFYIIAQLAGGIFATAIIKFMIPSEYQGNLGATHLSPLLTPGRGYLIECFLTFILVAVIYATSIDKDRFKEVGPIAIGFAIFGNALIGFRLTGASMNPARSFGPSLIANQWEHHWIYWLGPITGGLFATIIWDLIFRSRPPLPQNIVTDLPEIRTSSP